MWSITEKYKILILCFAVTMYLAVGCKDSTQSVAPDPTPDPDPSPDPDTTASDTLNPNIPDDYSDIAHISNFHKWGSYNVHDPTIIKSGDAYYMYSTDVFYGGGGVSEDDPRRRPKIPIRRSEDLVHWEPIGHVFSEMPQEVVEFMRKRQPSFDPISVWAPFIIKVDNQFRLYYSVPANDGMHMAYLGLAVSSDPEGPWEHKGLVLPTYPESDYNGIDPAISIDRDNGKHWLIYGSWDNGIHAVEIDPETGFRKNTSDVGDVIAARSLENGVAPLEGAEVQYNPEFNKYYLFVSYDPLIEPYNVRVGRADQPQGPYVGFMGLEMSQTTDNFPKITAQYQFNNHSGWQGVGHTGILKDGEDYYLASQGRLGRNIHLMDLHLRKMFWTEDGWPILSPQRYANIPQQELKNKDIGGTWEYIYLDKTDVKNESELITLTPDGKIEEYETGNWELDGNILNIEIGKNNLFEAKGYRGWDWENDRVCLLFTGLNDLGISGWGKKIQD